MPLLLSALQRLLHEKRSVVPRAPFYFISVFLAPCYFTVSSRFFIYARARNGLLRMREPLSRIISSWICCELERDTASPQISSFFQRGGNPWKFSFQRYLKKLLASSAVLIHTSCFINRVFFLNDYRPDKCPLEI